MIDLKDFFVMAFEGIKHRKIRSYLTMIGIFIGIASVVAFISLGQGLEDAVNEQFQSIGADKIMVTPSGGMGMSSMMGVAGAELTTKDLEAVRRVKGVNLAAARITSTLKLEYANQKKYGIIAGLHVDADAMELIRKVLAFEIGKGRMLRTGDQRSAVIGHRIAQGELFDKKVNVGSRLLVDDTNFRVVGALEKAGNPGIDNIVIIPIDVARNILDESDKVDIIVVEISKGYDIHDVVTSIKKDLRKLRGVKKGKEDFDVQTSEQLMNSMSSILDILQIFVVGIASISIIVGGVGVMNTLYTSVLERTQEIGIMKSIGAKNSHVMLVFLIESGFYGLIGGGIGCLIGLTLSKTIELIAGIYLNTPMLRAHISFELILGVLTFSFLIGVTSGVLPARQASKLKPVEALRYE